MTRVPTTSTYNLYLSQMTKQKASMTDYSYQSTTGHRYSSYDKYGLFSYRLITLQNEQNITSKYLETNSITQIMLDSQQTAMEGIRTALSDIRSQVRELYSGILTDSSEGFSEEELSILRNTQEAAFDTMSLISYYLNTQVDGNYIFGGGETTVKPVDFPYTTLSEFQSVYDGEFLTYPTSYSASLSKMSTSAEVLGGISIEQELQKIKQPFDYVGDADNKMTFSSSGLTANIGTFTGLVAGDQIELTGTENNDGTLTVASVSADGSLITFTEQINNEEITNSTNVKLTKTFEASIGNKMTFAASSLTANAGTFNGLVAGEQVTVTNSVTGNNNQTLTVVSVSDDGSTVTFQEQLVNESSSGVRLTNVSRNYAADAGNQMTFTEPKTLTAESAIFNGLVAGNKVLVSGTAGNNRVLTVADVSPDNKTVTFVEDISEEPASSTVVLDVIYDGSVENEMTFNNAGALSANAGTFAGLAQGDTVTIEGSTGAANDRTIAIASVSEDGSTILFTENVVNDPDLSTLTLTKAYTGSPSNKMTFEQDAKILMANAGTFEGLERGDEIAITGTAGNNKTLTVVSVSDDGDFLTFKESVSTETISDSSGVSINQASKRNSQVTDYVGSPTNRMEFTSGFSTLTAAINGTFSGLGAGDVVTLTGTENNDQTLTIHSVSADGRTIEFEDTGAETITDEILKDSSSVSLTKTYTASASNLMTFSAASLTATTAGTFTGLVAGDKVAISGSTTGNNNKTLTIASVSPDGTTVTFEEQIADEAIADSSSFALTTVPGGVPYGGSNTNPMTFSAANMTAAVNGTFFDSITGAGLAAGDEIVITGTTGNNQTLTVASVSADGKKIVFKEGVSDEPPSSTVVVDKSYNGSYRNRMTFVSPGALTADEGTFTGLSAGDQVVISGTGPDNDQTMIVASVSNDGSIVRFTQPVTAQTIPNSENVKIQQGSWKFESVFDPTTGETTNTLTGRAGAFSGLKPGKQVVIDGTVDNNHIMTVKSISADGSTIFFEENVKDELLNTVDLLNGTVNGFASITQNTQTGVIKANSNRGSVIETIEILQSPIIDRDANTITGYLNAFIDVTGGQTITITDANSNQYDLYVKSVSEDGTTLNISTSTPVPNLQPSLLTGPLTIETRSDISGFITSSLKGNAAQTGDVCFNKDRNTMTATVKNAFSRYNVGDSLIIKGADDNDKLYIVESVSKDGRTIKFSDETPIETDMSRYNGNFLTNGDGLTICKTYPVGSTVAMKGTDTRYNDLYTVLGVSDDGSEMTVRTENFPEYGDEVTFLSANFETTSYYQGGQLSSGYRISETTSIANDVNASASAFEKIFRALGSVAQGNILKEDEPEYAEKILAEALDLLDKAMIVNPNSKNDDVTSIQYSIITRLDQVKTTMENQQTVQASMDSYIAAMTQVDKTEAVTMLLQAAEDLKVSYSVLSTINSLSLLNYL